MHGQAVPMSVILMKMAAMNKPEQGQAQQIHQLMVETLVLEPMEVTLNYAVLSVLVSKNMK